MQSVALQNIETNEGAPFGAIQKKSKKSHNPKKNLSEKHQDSRRGSLVCFRVSGRRFCFFFWVWTSL